MEELVEQKDGKRKDGRSFRFSASYGDRINDYQFIQEQIKEVNKKDFGKEVTFSDLALEGIKLLVKQGKLEELKLNSKTPAEKLQDKFNEYLSKNPERKDMSLEDFICMKLKIQ